MPSHPCRTCAPAEIHFSKLARTESCQQQSAQAGIPNPAYRRRRDCMIPSLSSHQPPQLTKSRIDMLLVAQHSQPRRRVQQRHTMNRSPPRRHPNSPLWSIPEEESCHFDTRQNPIKMDRSDFISMYEVINYEREHRGLHALQRSALLDRLARAHALKMAELYKVIHSVDSVDDLKRRHRSQHVGENVQCGQSLRYMHDKTMNDFHSAHRANVLSSQFTEFGIGMARGQDGTIFVCQKFRGI